MISPLQGAFMRHLVRSQRPQTVLELGCYVGYSALWLAHGLQSLPGLSPPKLWTCERDSGIANLAKDNIKAAGLADTVHVLNASAKHVLEEWDSQQKLDLVFVDANKSACQLYYDLIMDRDLLSDHGQIIVDNVLFHGQVHPLIGDSGVSSAGPGSNIAHKMHRFNEHVAIDQRTDQVLLPMFDGLLLIQRVK
ncbi:hypothetical protein GGI02_002821 [Coemansia sp. RSA 2322]|nr:hypothetical protein GGI02_002821 [Coemansia sp. RSA 2322]